MHRFRSQQAAKYHIKASSTWFATRILPARDRLSWPHVMSFPFKENINLSKFVFVGSRNPIWMPRYLTPSPSGTHFNPTSCPHSHSLLLLLAQIVADFPQLILAHEALQNVSSTALALFMLSCVPLRYKVVSYANVWSRMQPPLGKFRPSTPCLGSSSMWPSTSIARINKYGASGHPCLIDVAN